MKAHATLSKNAVALSHAHKRTPYQKYNSRSRPTFCGLPVERAWLRRGSSSMASLVNEQHEWSALRVRQTFLDYFKQNGHTFGIGYRRDTDRMALTVSSAVIFSCSALRPYASLHQCWNEPVQVHLPWNCRSSIRCCQMEASCQLAKGRRSDTVGWQVLTLKCSAYVLEGSIT